MGSQKLIPITRISKWFSEEDYQLDISMGREAIEGDGNFTLILYKVDRINTQYDAVYGESPANGIRFLPPVELKVIPLLEEPENKAYNQDNTGRFQQLGMLSFSIYSAQLSELQIDIDYGDYIGYPISETLIQYYVVSDDDKKNFDNKHTVMGYKASFRTITCAIVDSSEFNGI